MMHPFWSVTKRRFLRRVHLLNSRVLTAEYNSDDDYTQILAHSSSRSCLGGKLQSKLHCAKYCWFDLLPPPCISHQIVLYFLTLAQRLKCRMKSRPVIGWEKNRRGPIIVWEWTGEKSAEVVAVADFPWSLCGKLMEPVVSESLEVTWNERASRLPFSHH